MGTTGATRRRYRGKILYIGDTTGERGREWFTVTVEPDGTRTLRAESEIDTAEINKTRVLRDVTMTLDGQWRPLDAFVRILIDDRFGGSTWFRFSEGLVECEGFTAGEGRISQKFPVDGWARDFLPHPVVSDVWHFAAWNLANAARRQQWTSFTTSPLPNGASGPMIGTTHFLSEYMGEESVTVPAGTFRCKHFRFPLDDDRPGAVQPEDCWLTGDDLLFVKIRWDFARTTYELVALEGWDGERKMTMAGR